MSKLADNCLKRKLLDLLHRNARLTAAQAAYMTNFTVSSCCRGFRELRDYGLVEIVWEETVCNGSKKLHYGLPAKTSFPSIGAGEYLGWRPTGTDPMSIDTIAPQA